MRDNLRLYGRYLGISVRAQLQYRASFLMQTFGHLVMTAAEIVGIWALFQRFGGLRGWTLAEVAMFYGVVQITWSIADAMARGFNVFGGTIKRGDFDRILLRPRSTVLQLAGQEFTLRRAGRFLQGLAVLLWAIHTLAIDWSPLKIALLPIMIGCGVCLFFGLVVLQATMCFWTTESLEIMNTLTYGGVETAQYPLSIYKSWFRLFFIYIVPLACVTYFPILAILGKPDRDLHSPVWFQWLAPLAGVIFLVVSLRIWQFGVRHYTSTGS
jgi:ABC-2 type transport system permease protein